MLSGEHRRSVNPQPGRPSAPPPTSTSYLAVATQTCRSGVGVRAGAHSPAFDPELQTVKVAPFIERVCRPPQLSGGWGGLRWRGVRRPRVGARTRYRWDGRRWLRLSGNGSRARRHRRHRRYWVGTRRHRVLQLHGGCGHRMIPSHRCPSEEAVIEPMAELPARWAPALTLFTLRFAACTCAGRHRVSDPRPARARPWSSSSGP